jgi:hypothetical protein
MAANATELTRIAINNSALDGTGLPVVVVRDDTGGGGGGLTDAQLRATPVGVSAAALPLPAGAATETGHLAAIDTSTAKIPALGQALAAASVPVVLTAIQQAALTPPAAIVGFALETGHLAAIDTSTAKIPSQGQALAAASLPVVLTAIQQAALTPPAAISGFALEAGHLAAIDTSTAKIPSQGQALAAGSLPVVLTAIQQAALTPPAAISGFALEAGHLAAIDTSTAKIPSLGQALAAASVPIVLTAIQQAALTPPAAITGFALEAGHLAAIDTATARIPAQGQALAAASVPVVLTAIQIAALTPPTAVAKGAQGATAMPTQDLKDSGRVNIQWTLEFSPAAVAEALMTMTESRDGAAVTTFTTKVVTNGKRLRVTSWSMTVENTLGVNPKRAKLRMKYNGAGAVVVASPLQANLVASVATAVNTVGQTAAVPFPDGIEYLGDGTKQIGFTLEFPDWVTAAQTGKVYVTITAFEY